MTSSEGRPCPFSHGSRETHVFIFSGSNDDVGRSLRKHELVYDFLFMILAWCEGKPAGIILPAIIHIRDPMS